MSEVSTIFQVWGDTEGWVALPRKKRSDTQVKGPKNHEGKWEEKMFHWPDETDKIVAWIRDSHSSQCDLYWCPSVFTQPRRLKENISTMSALYADLDEVSPQQLPEHLKPSMCWESSPGRYAAIWFPEHELTPEEGERLNRSITYSIGADKGGWDLTQVLRVPGLKNYKYEGAPKGKLLWFDPDHRISEKVVPMYSMPEPEEIEDIEVLSTKPLHELVIPYLDKLPSKVLSLLFTSEDDVLLMDRSAKLWELECSLLEHGVSPQDTLNMVMASSLNKYKNRRDEVRRLTTEIAKAVDYVEVKVTPVETKSLTTYSQLMGQIEQEPGWMIEGVWQKSSHGMIAGEPKTYKSVIVTDMAVSVASGQPFLGRYEVKHQGPVIYIQEENAPWLVKDRIAKIAHARGVLNGKADLVNGKLKVTMPQDLPLYFLNNQGFDLTNEEDKQLISQYCADIKPVLIIFDPLYLMLGGKDENSSKDIRPILNWLLKLRYDNNCSVIVLHHWNKSGKSERGGQRMLGSVLWHGWVESAMYTSIVNEEQHEIAIEREFRSFEKPTKLQVKFEFGAPNELSYKATMSDHVTVTDDIVLQLFNTYTSLTLEEVKTYLGVPKPQVQSRLNKLVKDKTLNYNGQSYRLERSKK